MFVAMAYRPRVSHDSGGRSRDGSNRVVFNLYAYRIITDGYVKTHVYIIRPRVIITLLHVKRYYHIKDNYTAVCDFAAVSVAYLRGVM